MINRVVLVGRLTRDPELRRTTSGVAVSSFTLAVDSRNKTPDGQKTAIFIPCTCWNQTADNVAKFTRKGSLVGVDGHLNQRSYDRKDGTKATIIEVIADSVQFLEPKGTDGPAAKSEFTPDAEQDESKNLSSIDIVDDDLPF